MSRAGGPSEAAIRGPGPVSPEALERLARIDALPDAAGKENTDV